MERFDKLEKFNDILNELKKNKNYFSYIRLIEEKFSYVDSECIEILNIMYENVNNNQNYYIELITKFCCHQIDNREFVELYYNHESVANKLK